MSAPGRNLRQWPLSDEARRLLAALRARQEADVAAVRARYAALLRDAEQLAAVAAGVPDEEGLRVRLEGDAFTELEGKETSSG